MRLLIKSIFIYFFIFQSYSLAYLDPGTGSNFVQIIIALLAGIGSFFGFYWRKTVIFIKNIGQKLKKNDKKKVEEDNNN